MDQIIPYLIQLATLGVCIILTSLFSVLAFRKRTIRRQLIIFSPLALIFFLATVYVWQIDFFGAESTNREDSARAFEENFNFSPPESVEEIKVKNFRLRDAFIHWMSFSYDKNVMRQILHNDQPLDTAYVETGKFTKIVHELEKSSTNAPGWWRIPEKTTRIFFKRDFMNHISSDYFIWYEPADGMVYLQVSYFD